MARKTFTVTTSHPHYGTEIFEVGVDRTYRDCDIDGDTVSEPSGFYASAGNEKTFLGCGKTRDSAAEAIREIMFNNGRDIVTVVEEQVA